MFKIERVEIDWGGRPLILETGQALPDRPMVR